MATTGGTYQIHTQERGAHWIAWVSRDGGGKPDRGVILVAETKAQVETRARAWAEQTTY
jgi:hypothetical protein